MREEDLNGWEDLCRLAYENKNEKWIYRGVTRHYFELVPKIGRKDALGKRLGKRLKYTEAAERALLREFARQARPLVSSEPKNELEWMAVAQHHGLKTRLLDWTESIFVAAMFATERGLEIQKNLKKRTPVPPAIYGVRNIPDAEKDEYHDPFNIDQIKLYRPPHISPRIAPQQALFTIHPDPEKKFDTTEIVKWKLNINTTVYIKSVLDTLGVSRAALFPGIDGLADALNWRHRWNRLNA